MKTPYRKSRPGSRDGGSKFSGAKKPWKSGSDHRDGDRPELHDATCGACGRPCQVPFRPNGSKPVLCRDCFRKGDNSAPARFERPSFGDKPRFSKFGSRPPADNGNAKIEARLTAIEAKLDTLIAAMTEEDEE